MADLLELREDSGTSLCQEVTKLTAALQEYQLMVQVPRQHRPVKTFLNRFRRFQ